MDGALVVSVEGPPRQRGRQYGETCRALIADAVASWRDSLAQATGLDPDDYLRRFLAATDHEPAIERWTPGLLDEVRGLAEGAAIDPRTALAYQLIDEEWCFRRTLSPPTLASRCSSFGVADAGRRPLVAQNLDLWAELDGFQVLLRLRDEDGMEAMLVCYAGVLALNGLNSSGLGVCVNTISQLRSATTGLPVVGVIRGLLGQTSLSDAVAFARTVPHASGQNYVIGSGEGVADLECSANRVVEWMPGAARVAHTNHPLVSDDRWDGDGSIPIAGLDGSLRRFDALHEQLLGDSRPVTVERARQVLSGPVICRVPNATSRAISLASVVMEVGHDPVLHLAPGPPSLAGYERFTFAQA